MTSTEDESCVAFLIRESEIFGFHQIVLSVEDLISHILGGCSQICVHGLSYLGNFNLKIHLFGKKQRFG